MPPATAMEELTRKLQSSEITLAEFLREQQLVLSRGEFVDKSKLNIAGKLPSGRCGGSGP